MKKYKPVPKKVSWMKDEIEQIIDQIIVEVNEDYTFAKPVSAEILDTVRARLFKLFLI